jgi:hypothetical protein
MSTAVIPAQAGIRVDADISGFRLALAIYASLNNSSFRAKRSGDPESSVTIQAVTGFRPAPE